MKTIGTYQLLRQIGQGSYGSVYQAKKTGSSQSLAIKMISTSHLQQKQIDLVQMQIQVLEKIDYPSIIKLLDVRRTKNNYYLVFEFCQKGDLEKYLKKHSEIPLKEEIVQKLIYHVSDAVRVLHGMGVVHRDIKLANILLTKDFAVKLSDFGFAKTVNHLMETYCGTPINMAPEILLRQQYTLKCDIWSLGIVLFQLAYGKLPFSPDKGKGIYDLIEIIQDFKEVTFPKHPILPESFKALIRASLQKDPEKRISVEEFFNNEWVQAGKNTMINTSNMLKTISFSQEIEFRENLEMTETEIEVQGVDAEEEGEGEFDEIEDEKLFPGEITNTEKAICSRIHKSILSYLTNHQNLFSQLFKPQNLLSLNQPLFQDFLLFLHYSYIKSIKTSPIKIICSSDSFDFQATEIPSLSSSLLLPQKSKSNYSLNTLIDLLTSVADSQKHTSKEESLKDYKIIISLLRMFERPGVSLEVTGAVEGVRLKNVRKCLMEKGFEGEHQNGLIVHMRVKERNEEFMQTVEKVKRLCEERVACVEAEIANKN